MNTDAVELRAATQADLLAVYRIEKASFPQPWPFSAFESFLGEPAFLVAVDGSEQGAGGRVVESGDERIVGYLVADSVPNHGHVIGHVKDLAVAPDRRGEGIARRLLSAGLSILASEGDARVKLEVREDNEPAISLYREFGFELQRRIPQYYADGETALVMERSITA